MVNTSAEKEPDWAKKLTREVMDLKKQTVVNCDKLTKIDTKLSTMNAELGGIRGRLNSVETHLGRQDGVLQKLVKKS